MPQPATYSRSASASALGVAGGGREVIVAIAVATTGATGEVRAPAIGPEAGTRGTRTSTAIKGTRGATRRPTDRARAARNRDGPQPAPTTWQRTETATWLKGHRGATGNREPAPPPRAARRNPITALRPRVRRGRLVLGEAAAVVEEAVGDDDPSEPRRHLSIAASGRPGRHRVEAALQLPLLSHGARASVSHRGQRASLRVLFMNLNRSRSDGLEGFTGMFTRGKVKSSARAGIQKVLEHTESSMELGPR